MKTNKLAAVMIALSALAGSANIAWSMEAKGEIRKIDTGAKKITLKHGPIKSLEMDEGMTMVFAVKDGAVLAGLKVGDKVSFDASRINGQYVVTAIQKSR